MGYRLRMSAEIHDWLADLRDSDPPAALLAGQALAALAEHGDGLGPALVVSPPGRPRPEELPEALDLRYQDLLDSLTVMRTRVAETATQRRDVERQIAESQSPDAELRQLLAGLAKAEERLTAASIQQQTRADAFRTRKEVLKARYTAARAAYLVDEALGADAGHDEAAAGLGDVTGEMERELGLQAPEEDLLDLRPGAPGDSDIRILFAVEPPGTALLLAVLEGRDAVRDHYREAASLAAGVLRRVRAGQAPEAVTHAYDDTRSFLGEFCPGGADEVSRAASALVAANRPRPLAEQRTRLGLTQAQVAQRMGVPQDRVSAIERADPGATEVRTLAGYVEALGGRLDVVADFGGERIPLR